MHRLGWVFVQRIALILILLAPGTLTTLVQQAAAEAVAQRASTEVMAHQSAATCYLWDNTESLPTLVDDGTNAYLSANGLRAAINGSGTTSYALDDALGSVRGVTDSSGAIIGSTDYDAFGAARAQTGSTLPLGFAGELTDPTTGFLDLRARDLDPALGRFLSRDSVSPNAPGTQGYSPYAYVANNPTTWTDPSGHMAGAVADTLYLLQAAFRFRQYTTSIIQGVALLDTGSPLQKVGGAVELMFTAVACALDTPCRALAEFFGTVIDTYGSLAPAGPWTIPIQSMRFAIHHFPTIPTRTLCTINDIGIVYSATRTVPTSVAVRGAGSGGVGGLGPDSCETASAGSEQVDSTIRNYSPTVKHDPVYSRNPQATLMDLDDTTAQQVLNEGYQSGKSVWGYYNGKIYKFLPEDDKNYHGFPVPGNQAPSEYLRQLRANGTISNAQYNRLKQQGK